MASDGKCLGFLTCTGHFGAPVLLRIMCDQAVVSHHAVHVHNVAMPFVPSSVLVPSSDARSPVSSVLVTSSKANWIPGRHRSHTKSFPDPSSHPQISRSEHVIALPARKLRLATKERTL